VGHPGIALSEITMARQDHNSQRSQQPSQVCEVHTKFVMARDHDSQAEFTKSTPSSQWSGQVHEVKAEFVTARDHDGQAKFVKSTPSL